MDTPQQLATRLQMSFALGQWDAAERLCQQLMQVEPQNPAWGLMQARILFARKQYAPALAALQSLQGLGLPTWPELYSLKARVLGALERIPEALQAFETALAQGSQEAEDAYLYGLLQGQQGNLHRAHRALFSAWQAAPDQAHYGSVLLFYTTAFQDLQDTHRVALFKDWARRYADPLTPRAPVYSQQPDPERRLRVGFVSGDFREHAVNYDLWPLFKGVDRSQFELFAYAQQFRSADTMTQAFRAQADHWREIQDLSDEAVAAQIQADQIDILIDCSGHTEGQRLGVFARKPAPVQISAFGFVFTTGLQAMDYQFSDPIATPPAREHLFTERIIQLSSQIHWRPLSPQQEALPVSPPPFEQQGWITFGSGNGAFKHNEKVVALWAAILKAVPHSRLALKHSEFGKSWVQQAFRQRFAAHGIAPERLLFQGKTSALEHMRFYQQLDIALDPFPYTGGMTTCETLYMGVPVVALDGDGIRTSPSLLTLAGVPELLAADPESYGRLAVDLARSPERLRHYRQHLRQQLLDSPIANTPGFIWEVYTALRHVWRLWCLSQTGGGASGL